MTSIRLNGYIKKLYSMVVLLSGPDIYMDMLIFSQWKKKKKNTRIIHKCVRVLVVQSQRQYTVSGAVDFTNIGTESEVAGVYCVVNN